MKLDMEINKENSVVESKAPSKTAQKSFGRFIITSGLFHIMAASAIVITNHVPANETEKDLVVIDFSAPVEANSAPEYAPAPEQAATAASQPLAAAEAEPAAAEPTAVEVAKPIQASAPVPPPATKPAPVQAAQEVPQAIPVIAPVTAQQAAPQTIDPQEIDQELNQVDAQNDQEVLNETAKIKEESDKAEKSLAESAKLAEQKLKQEEAATAAKIKARTEALKKEEAAKAAAALAATKATAEKAEKENAAKLAAEEKAQAAKLAAEENAAAEQAAAATEEATPAEKTQEGSGEKNAGPGEISSEVRALDQLRQMPGNPKPQYDSQERLKGHMGVVVFQAFVTKEGQLTDFQLLKSSGHRNLDAKTLKALKQWKFYPGQEGSVELPFNWNLKGGPQEMPAFLRRKVGKAP